MFKYLVFIAAIGLSTAAIRSPVYGKQNHGHSSNSYASSDEAHAEIKVLHSEVHPDGFRYDLETSNGIQSAQSGDANGNMQGNFQWVSPEGEHMQISYVADENGYQPQGDILPTSPPIPDAILRSLEYIRTHPPKEEPANKNPSASRPAFAYTAPPKKFNYRRNY
ncbi:larval cuticle protein 2-like [Eurosta solidaginis]|uniref:larval cuticle protein 2-like n=1 Tax=Eurosta solidaginis TaxID=178769 RepID=UPI003530B335